MRELWIWMGDRRVGTLDATDRRSPRIEYDDEWIADRAATPLSTSMPLAGRFFAGAWIAAWLWGLLPDNERVLERWARRYQCSATDVVGLLGHVGSDVAGAARFLPPATTPDDGDSQADVAVDDTDIATMLRDLRDDATAWHPRLGGRWSLAGAQAKVALARDELTGRWSIPSGTAATTHILKPAIAGLDHHDLNEHLCLRTAGELGMPVARSEVGDFAGEAALVIARYDRVVRDDKVVRVHQEDLCQALGVAPAGKYEADGGPSITDIIDVLDRAIIDRPRSAIERLLRAVAFNWLILGTDAHAKNYSLLLSGSQVRLAPLYDLASAVVLRDHPRKLRLAQKVEGEYRPTVIGARHWARLGADAGVGEDWMLDTTRAMAEQLPDALTTVIASTELDDASEAFASGLLDGIAAWSADCRGRLT